MTLKIKRLHKEAKLPHRATEGSAGADLCACLEGAPLRVAPGQRMLVPTGLSIELPGPDTVALIFARSGLAIKQGLAMANGVGVIDSDYRGELCVPVVNLSADEVTIAHGDRVAQLVVMPVLLPQYEECDELNDTVRGEGGFGSTGVQ